MGGIENKKLKEEVRILRVRGLTYTEIKESLRVDIPKATMATWCKGIRLTDDQRERIDKMGKDRLERLRPKALAANRLKREKYLNSVRLRVVDLPRELDHIKTAKITLAMLHLGEGGKSQGGSLMFGNSDPFVIKLFLKLLRQCYDVREDRLRCKVQMRTDMNGIELEKYWSQVTNIPASRFYKTWIDKRTIGKPSKKKNYKGVCRLEYFSADVYNELTLLNEEIKKQYTGL